MIGRHISAWVLLLATGCGAAAVVPREGTPQTIRTAEGMLVEVVPRETAGVIYASLWIDVGSADASPPQLALFAALAAEAAAGPGAQAFATPTGTEIAIRCDAPMLDRCLARLARALSVRKLDEATVTELRERVASTRRAANADPSRRADGLALRALLGEDAARFDPLGDGVLDERLTEETATRFLADHYGPNRALLVLVGEDARAKIEQRVSRHFARVERARTSSRSALPELAPRDGLLVEAGDSGSVISAMAVVDSRPSADRLARELDEAIEAPELLVRSFSLGTLSFVNVQRRTRDTGVVGGVESIAYPLRARLAEGLGRAPKDGPTRDPVRRSADLDLAGVARQRGLDYVARAAADPAARGSFPRSIGVGVVAQSPRFDTNAEEREVAFVAEVERGIELALARAKEATAAPMRGSLRDAYAAVALANGARIDVRQRPDRDEHVVAVRFEGGVLEEPPAEHGRTALLAEILASTCGGPARALPSRLGAIGARIEPYVDAEGFGFVLAATRLDSRTLDLLLSCIRRPDFHRESVEDARLGLLSRIRARGSHQQMLGWAARAASGAAPGLVAPLGSAETLSAIPVPSLARTHRSSAVGARLAVAVITPEPADDVAQRIARRLIRLSSGARPSQAIGAASSDPIAVPSPIAMEWSGAVPRVVVAIASDAAAEEASGTAAAEAFAASLAARMHKPGCRPIAIFGTASGRGTYAAVALDVAADQLDDLPALVAQARADVETRAIADAKARLRKARFRGGSSADEAKDLTRRRFRPAPGATVEELIRALARSDARFAIGLPPAE